MFRVKICGINSIEDAQVAAEAGADAVGLNFYPASPRSCALDTAAEIARALPPQVCKVGVFVNASVEQVRRAAREVPLDLVQLHGDETAEYLREIRSLPILRALPAEGDLAPIADYLATCHRLGAMPRMLLVDAPRAGQYGGSGTTADWEQLARHRQRLAGAPLVLAGGLNADNVAAAIALVRPWAVDVASGVEIAPGKKSPELVARFVSSAKNALDRLTRRS